MLAYLGDAERAGAHARVEEPLARAWSVAGGFELHVDGTIRSLRRRS